MQPLLTCRLNRLWFVNGVLLCLLPALTLANHIIGGNISMRAVGTAPGQFRIQLSQFWDNTQLQDGNKDPSVTVLIFSKTGPKLVQRVKLDLRETLPLLFNNEACARQRKLNFVEGRYYDLVQLDPAKYTDPAGYYIVWERCCRNNAITNANTATADGLGIAFYMEFPAMTKAGQPFTNSSPEFKLPNGDYICLNKPFSFDMSATDADGDQLVYTLVAPLNGYTTKNNVAGNETPRTSYPTVGWATGYGLSNVIPGNPALRVDANTGKISVQATQEGLFLFTVQCEEFRDGQRIGVVRRDFQLPVIDCSLTKLPPAVVSVNNQVVLGELPWCASQPLVLRTEKNPLFQYQWQRDGSNLRGATTDTLRVTDSGKYSVVKSLARSCANDTTSEITVNYVTAPPVSLSLASPKPLCADDMIQLQATGKPGYTYRWQRDGADLPGQQEATLRVSQSGRYTVLARPEAANCEGMDSVRITVNPRPTVQASASRPIFCPGDSVVLTAVSQPGNQYQWQRDGSRFGLPTARILAREAGQYRALVTAATGCTALSAPLALAQYPRSNVRLDSLAPFCGVGANAQTLNGQPGGGVYAGPGVTGSRFDPAVAGVGQHALTYTITSVNGCRAVQRTTATVAPGPQLTGPDAYTLFRGSQVELTVNVSEPMGRYGWSPPDFLSRTDVASPVASPMVTTPYQLTALSVAGCPASFSVLVEVIEPVYVPTAFSPNGDGMNDVWTIANIEKFPDCDVSVFNRWGELVFHSRGYAQPWNGTYGPNKVRTGVYTYQIKTGQGPFSTTFRGALTVLP